MRKYFSTGCSYKMKTKQELSEWSKKTMYNALYAKKRQKLKKILNRHMIRQLAQIEGSSSK